MKMKPILFNTDMVREILEGCKTVTRRAMKPQPRGHAALLTSNLLPETTEAGAGAVYAFEDGTVTSPPYRPGDVLYVRETWTAWSRTYGTIPRILYKADRYTDAEKIKWRPSIHMPREAARIFLRVTDVRADRLWNITEEQAKAEGLYKGWAQTETSSMAITAKQAFMWVWDRTIKPGDLARYGWIANPWVWVIEFDRISREEMHRC